MGACIGIMAGGTGGHVFPALAVAETLRAQGAQVFWIGTQAGFETRVVPAYGFEIEWITIEGLRGKNFKQRLRAPYKLINAIRQLIKILRRRRPDLLLGFGGFVAGPGGIVGRLLNIPLIIHEQNQIPGVTNRILAWVATQVLEAFPNSLHARHHAIVTGNPVRESITKLPPPRERLLNQIHNPPKLLILGGSQGAQALNEALPSALAALPIEYRPHIRHQTGTFTLENTKATYQKFNLNAEVIAFIEDMAKAYAWADLVICRAGALTIAELTAAGVTSILIPYPFAVDDHQTSNARYLADAQAAYLLPQTELNQDKLINLLTKLFSDRENLITMAERARNLARPEASNQIAKICFNLIQ